MKKYVEIGYPVYPGMPVYPGLPEVELKLREDLLKGDYWNGSVLTTYLHAGTHVDAPWHYMGGDAPKLDDLQALPTESFVYEHPILINVDANVPNYEISVEDLKKAGDELYEADAIFFNTALISSADFRVFLNAKLANSLRTCELTQIVSSRNVLEISSAALFFLA